MEGGSNVGSGKWILNLTIFGKYILGAGTQNSEMFDMVWGSYTQVWYDRCSVLHELKSDCFRMELEI